ncbi:MAG: HEAT repeat domain-containing protein [Planctomycetota bacterium]|nr:HEAT repeat domain-containing protein [Planctomycetota bacterium]
MAMTRHSELARVCGWAMLALCALAVSPRYSAPACAAETVDEILAQKIDVDFWRDYPEEVLALLEIRTGLKSVCPSTIERTFIFNLQEKDLPVKTLLEKLTAAGRLEMERRAGLLVFWQKADDKTLKELGEKLQSADRWARCEAAWDLGNLADPRIYPLLFQAAGDPDSGVVKWALSSLGKHLSVLPYLDAAGKEAAVKAAQASLGKTQFAFFQRFSYHQLLGALNTPASVDILLAALKGDDANARASAVDGLGYSKDPRAVDALVKLADESAAAQQKQPQQKQPQPWRGVGFGPQTAPLLYHLPEALARIGDPRCVDALIALSENAKLTAYTRGQCLGALSRTRNRKAGDTVVQAIARGVATDWNPYFWVDARDPRIADALAAHVQDANQQFREAAIGALARARDPRAIAPLVYSIKESKHTAYGKPEQLAAIRDSRAEQAILDFIKEDKEGDPWGMRNWGGALAATRDPKVMEAAFELLKDDNNAMDIRCYASKVLASGISNRQQMAEFIAYLKTAGKPVVRATAQRGQPQGNVVEAIFSKDPAWVEILTELAHDPDRTIGDAALRMLGMSQNPYAQKALIEEFRHADAKVRLGAVRACAGYGFVTSGRPGDPVVAEALAGKLTDDDAAMRKHAAIALGQLGDKRAVEPLIQAARTEKNTPEAYTIWSLLGSFEEPKAAEALIELVKDPNNPQREQMLYSLNASKSPKIAEALLEMAGDKNMPLGVRAVAATQLHRTGTKDQKVMDVLWELLKDPKLDWNNRMYVVTALQQSDDPKISASLLAFVRNKDIPQEARENAVGHISAAEFDKDTKEKFFALLDDQELPAGLRAKTAVMLGGGTAHRGRTVAKAGETDARVLNALLALQKSKELSDGVRRSLTEGLVYSGDQKALQAVYDSIAGADLKTKLSIAMTLSSALKDEKAIQPLLDVLKDGEPQDRRSAAYALGPYGKAENTKDDVKQKIKAALDEYEKTKDIPVRPPQPPPGEF